MTTDIDRRRFLTGAGAGLAGAALLGGGLPLLGRPPSARASTGASMLSRPATESPIDHIFVIMMENRSVDHYLGWLPDEPGFSGFDANQHQSFLNESVDGNGDPRVRNHDLFGQEVPTFHLTSDEEYEGSKAFRGCDQIDPGHGWESGRAQRDEGFLAADSRNDRFALGYYEKDDLSLYPELFTRFTTFDKYFCSILTSTFPNREYQHSAQSGGIKTNALPIDTLGFDWETIWDRLDPGSPGANQVKPTGAYYFVDLPAIALWGSRMIPYARHLEHFFADVSNPATCPNVVFIDPGFTTGLRCDDHPYADIRAGQNFVATVLSAIVNSPVWHRSAVFLNYDEWGGFFDHVSPPVVRDARESSDDLENFGQLGFRVPCVMASPYARRGTVDSELYDHTSILRFIEWRFFGAPAHGPGSGGVPDTADGWWLTTRDRHTNNIGASLGTEPDPELGFLLTPRVPVTSDPCPGEELEGIPGVPGELGAATGAVHDAGKAREPLGEVDLTPLTNDAPDQLDAAAESAGADSGTTPDPRFLSFQDALEIGYFEAVGFTPRLEKIPGIHV